MDKTNQKDLLEAAKMLSTITELGFRARYPDKPHHARFDAPESTEQVVQNLIDNGILPPANETDLERNKRGLNGDDLPFHISKYLDGSDARMRIDPEKIDFERLREVYQETIDAKLEEPSQQKTELINDYEIVAQLLTTAIGRPFVYDKKGIIKSLPGDYSFTNYKGDSPADKIMSYLHEKKAFTLKPELTDNKTRYYFDASTINPKKFKDAILDIPAQKEIANLISEYTGEQHHYNKTANDYRASNITPDTMNKLDRLSGLQVVNHSKLYHTIQGLTDSNISHHHLNPVFLGQEIGVKRNLGVSGFKSIAYDEILRIAQPNMNMPDINDQTLDGIGKGTRHIEKA